MTGGRRATTLRSEVVASVTLVASVAILLVGMLIVQALHAHYVERRILELQRTAGLLVRGLEGLARGFPDIETLRKEAQRFLAESVAQEDLKVLWIDENGTPLWGGEQASDTRLSPDFLRALKGGLELARIQGEGGLWPLWGTRTLAHFSPVSSPEGGRTRGGLLVEIPAEGAWEALQRRGWFLPFYVGLVMAVLIFLGSYLLSKNVVRPLRRLMEVSEKIASAQHREVSWEGFPPHEVGRLAQAMRSMSEALQDKQGELEEKLEALEEANKALQEAQRAMIRTEKLASVGRLAAGVAHEIGNPIASVLGYVDLLLEDEGDPRRTDCLLRVKEESERIQRTVRALVEVGRPSGRRWERVDLGLAVEEVLSVLRVHPGMRGIQVHWEPMGDAPMIWADPDQIRQVLLNLLLNSMDALGGSGEISVRTGWAQRLPTEMELVPPPRRRDDPTDRDFSALRKVPSPSKGAIEGPFAYVEVHDTGGGIAPEDMERLFEPFFTTKDPGKGTGLGLTVCLGIVESYDGRIKVESQKGKGTTFTVYLPVGYPQKGC